MAGDVLAVEKAYVAVATGRAVTRGDNIALRPRALAAIGAVASRYLAVGTPRSFGVIADPRTLDAAVSSLAAHRTWFQPSDLRCAGPAGDALAAAIGGRTVTLDEALASDIVCIHMPITLTAEKLRRGSHVNVLVPCELADDLERAAMITHEHPGLGDLAAGLVDGRQLDEITVFIVEDAVIAIGALESSASIR
ncbi:MAG: hypothetical protein AB7O24_05240 [Kofleriaceae bacterium]